MSIFSGPIRLDAWWGARATTPNRLASQIDSTLGMLDVTMTPNGNWEIIESKSIWPDDTHDQTDIVARNVSRTDPDSHGNVQDRPDRGYAVALAPATTARATNTVGYVRFSAGSQSPVQSMIFNRVEVESSENNEKFYIDFSTSALLSICQIWLPEFVSLSTGGTRILVDRTFTSPRPGLVMWFSDRLPCVPGVARLGYPRLVDGVLVDLRSLVEDSADPELSLTKVYTQLEGVGAFDPIPPKSPLEP